MKRSFIREILESINGETISFAGGLPDESLFPVQGLGEAAGKIFTRPECLQYTLSGGIMPLRQKIAAYYAADGVPTGPENILVTTGSQQALYVISRYFSGNRVVIEEPSYLGAVNIFRMNGMEMLPVPLAHDGPDMKKFSNAFSKARLAYMIPDFHNPAGSCCSQEKREQAAEAVRGTNGWLIEDSPYSELYFSGRKRSLVSMVPEHTLHLGSFSKTLSPSFRIGWVRADEEIIRELIAIKEAIDLHSCGISQYILNEYLEDAGAYGRHLESLRGAYREKMEFFSDALRRILPQFSFHRPEGGMFIYGRLEGTDTYELVQRCMKEQVVFVPGSEFYQDDRKTSEIRFNYTRSGKSDIEKGLRIIRNVL